MNFSADSQQLPRPEEKHDVLISAVLRLESGQRPFQSRAGEPEVEAASAAVCGEEDESRRCRSPLPGILLLCLRRFEFRQKKNYLRQKKETEQECFHMGEENQRKRWKRKEFWGLVVPAAALPPGLFLPIPPLYPDHQSHTLPGKAEQRHD